MSTIQPSKRIVVIAASAGGVTALRHLFAGLEADFAWPIAVVLHIGGDNIDGLLDVLGADSPLPVIEARHGETPLAGTIHVAPGGYHLLVERDHRFALSVDARVCFARPSADVLFSSAADAYGAGAIGMVLTGTNDDGAQGLADIRSQAGLSFVQEPREAEEPAMPLAALAHAGADAVLTLDGLARRLMMEFRK